ncbi:MAG TPA: hypothetical protein VGL59_05095 [Polyangia bacterium]|jgi:hypothetical protein
MKRALVAATVGAGLSLCFGLAQAQMAPIPTPPPPPPAPPPGAPPPAMPPPEISGPTMPQPSVSPAPGGDPMRVQPTSEAASPTLKRDLTAARVSDVSYGVAMRFRWVSVPAWMLNVFTKKNVPLGFTALPGAWAIEGFRRKQNFDIAVSVGYQAMSPPDGNWLGTGKDPAVDTDFVQFRNLGMVNADISFVWHAMFTDWIGMHYGAGLGVGFVTGNILRTSDSAACTDANLGDLTKCHPVNIQCTPTSCPEAALAATSRNPPDTADHPSRFTDPDVPSVIPIINAVVGVDFRVPSLRGWEAKIEGGFYDALFLGGGVGYTF